MKKIGIMGVDLDNMNKGVAALGFGLINVINQSENDVEFYLYTETSKQSIELLNQYFSIPEEKVHIVPVYFKKISTVFAYCKSLRKLDFLVDITGGDSFSDIYGVSWMIRSILPKMLSIITGTKLILAPQTYGPFNTFFGKKLASFIIEKSTVVMSRDQKSIDSLKKITNKKIELMTDVAFTLPFDKDMFQLEAKRKVGVNVSQLLWNGGYQGNNQFGLKTDYIDFSKAIVKNLLSSGYKVYLISHVVREYKNEEELDLCENDLVAANKIHEIYPETVVVPAFKDPIEAKSYISKMDLFIGARMHATIAAASTSVAVIPVAYSRKFSGLYNNLKYPYVVDLTVLGTTEAIKKVEKFVYMNDDLSKSITSSQVEIQKQVNNIFTKFSKVLSE